MFVELIEHFRCPAQHEESLLVVAATRSEQRHILDGVLGCPACGAEYPIAGGVARFGTVELPEPEHASVETAMRLAAFLELTDARGFAVLCGRWAAHALPLADLVETPLLLVNPPRGADVSRAAAVIETGSALPLAPGSARAIALDPALPIGGDHAVRCVRQGGRVLAPAAMELPAGLTEIARDARDWVAEKTAAPESAPRLVALKRAR